MGKYFKEYNNKRISKASQLDIEALAGAAIRMAALPPVKIPPAIKQIAPRIKNIFMKPTTLQDKPGGLLPGELGFTGPAGAKAIQPGKAPGAYAAGSFIPGAQGLSKFLKIVPGVGPTLSKVIQSVDFITAAEKYFPRVNQLLSTRYRVMDYNLNPPAQPRQITVTLKQILEGLDQNGIVQIANRELMFSEQNINSILADMQSLDEYAKKWAKIKAIAAASGISIYEAVVEFKAHEKGAQDIREHAKKAGEKAGKASDSKPTQPTKWEDNAAKREQIMKEMFPQGNSK